MKMSAQVAIFGTLVLTGTGVLLYRCNSNGTPNDVSAVKQQSDVRVAAGSTHSADDESLLRVLTPEQRASVNQIPEADVREMSARCFAIRGKVRSSRDLEPLLMYMMAYTLPASDDAEAIYSHRTSTLGFVMGTVGHSWYHSRDSAVPFPEIARSVESEALRIAQHPMRDYKLLSYALLLTLQKHGQISPDAAAKLDVFLQDKSNSDGVNAVILGMQGS